jgi:hypothetical protein
METANARSTEGFFRSSHMNQQGFNQEHLRSGTNQRGTGQHKTKYKNRFFITVQTRFTWTTDVTALPPSFDY